MGQNDARRRLTLACPTCLAAYLDGEAAASGRSTTGARHTANLFTEGSNTVTWLVYRPGCRRENGTLKRNGTAFDSTFKPPAILYSDVIQGPKGAGLAGVFHPRISVK